MTDFNGSEVLLASLLGEIKAQNGEQIRLMQVQTHSLERLMFEMSHLPNRLATAIEQNKKPMGLLGRLGLSPREAAMLLLALLVGLVGLFEGRTLREVLLAANGIPG